MLPGTAGSPAPCHPGCSLNDSHALDWAPLHRVAQSHPPILGAQVSARFAPHWASFNRVDRIHATVSHLRSLSIAHPGRQTLATGRLSRAPHTPTSSRFTPQRHWAAPKRGSHTLVTGCYCSASHHNSPHTNATRQTTTHTASNRKTHQTQIHLAQSQHLDTHTPPHIAQPPTQKPHGPITKSRGDGAEMKAISTPSQHLDLGVKWRPYRDYVGALPGLRAWSEGREAAAQNETRSPARGGGGHSRSAAVDWG